MNEVIYICDGKRCDPCDYENCGYTTDIDHAAFFRKIEYGGYQECVGVMSEEGEEMISKDITHIKNKLEDRKRRAVDINDIEGQAFLQELLDLIDEMEKDSAASYYEGKSDGMETMARILIGSEG